MIGTTCKKLAESILDKEDASPTEKLLACLLITLCENLPTQEEIEKMCGVNPRRIPCDTQTSSRKDN